MPRSNLGYILTAFFGLAAYAYGLGVFGVLDWAGQPQRYPHYYDGGDKPGGTASAARPQTVQGSREKEPCIDERSRDESDLCAQWRAANAAEDAAWSAWLQLLIGALGMIGLGVTLWFNRRSLNVAERAIEEARRTGEAQARAYLSVKDAKLTFDKWGVAELSVTIFNSGNSPARQVSWHFELNLAVITGGFWPAGGWCAPFPVGDIVSGGSITVKLDTCTAWGGGSRMGFIPHDRLGEFFSQTYAVAANIKISGKDVFDQPIEFVTQLHNLSGVVAPDKLIFLGQLGQSLPSD